MTALPLSIAAFVDELAGSSGVEAVVLGGSRANGSADSHSDWDLGVFYRGSIDLSVVSARGEVHPPGSWGRLMNGGAWLQIDGERVDVLLRDLDVVEHWAALARRGEYEVDSLLGYVAGFPTYTLVAEVVSSRLLHGRLNIDTEFTDALAASSTQRWGFQRDFSLDYARSHAVRGNRVAALGNLARAVVEEAHRRLCERREWSVNEKRLLDRVGLESMNHEFVSDGDVDALIERVAHALRP